MRVWVLLVLVLSVATGGCGPRAPEAEMAPGPVGRTPEVRIVSAEPSPAGDKLVIGLSSSSGRPNTTMPALPSALWVVDLGGGRAHQLPSSFTAVDRGPMMESFRGVSWRPDGGALASATGEGRLEVYNLARGTSRIVSPEGMECGRPIWSPEGRRLVFTALTGKRDGPRIGLYSVPADGSGPPRPENDKLGGDLWYRSVVHARFYVPRHRRPVEAEPGRAAHQRVLDELSWASSVACSRDGTKLAYSGPAQNPRAPGERTQAAGGVVAVVDRSLTTVMRYEGSEVLARRLFWSPDGRKLLACDSPRQAYLFDVTAKTVSPADDPLIAAKEPVGWVQWDGRSQLAFIDEQWKRLVITEKIGAPAYTLVVVQEDGTPSLVLPLTKGK